MSLQLRSSSTPEGGRHASPRFPTRAGAAGCDPRPPRRADATPMAGHRARRTPGRCDPRPPRRADATHVLGVDHASMWQLRSSSTPEGGRHRGVKRVQGGEEVVAILVHPEGGRHRRLARYLAGGVMTLRSSSTPEGGRHLALPRVQRAPQRVAILVHPGGRTPRRHRGHAAAAVGAVAILVPPPLPCSWAPGLRSWPHGSPAVPVWLFAPCSSHGLGGVAAGIAGA